MILIQNYGLESILHPGNDLLGLVGQCPENSIKKLAFRTFLLGYGFGHCNNFITGSVYFWQFRHVGAANPVIAYALSNAAPVVAMLWGIFVWKELKDADRETNQFLETMFTFYIIGLVLITLSNV